MTQHSVRVDDLNEETEEAREYAAQKRKWEIWERMRTQQVVSFVTRTTNGWPEAEINTWLMKNPDWRIAQITTTTYSEAGDYGATWIFIVHTIVMEKHA